MKKNKKEIIGVITILAVLIIVITILIIKNQPKPEETMKQYISFLNDKNYDEMYQLLNQESKDKITKEDFITRNKNIYEGIDCFDVKLEIQEIEKQNKNIKITYQESMETVAGNISFSNSVLLNKEEKQYKLKWSSSIIFPQLRDSDKVRIATIKGQRGEIIDRNGIKLAENGFVSSIGIVPRKIRRK